MSELSPVDPIKRLNPKTYHPDLQPAVEVVYARGIELVVFPALLRGDKVGDLVKYLNDGTRVHKKPCRPCVSGSHACILHNGSSLRCLNCYVGDARECSHQTGMYMQIFRARFVLTPFAEMEKLGHAKAPPCMRYDVAEELGLTPVPDGYVWGGKDKNQEFLKTLRRRGDTNQAGPSGASNPAEDEAQETDGSDEDYKSSGEEVDELADDDPPPLSQKKAKSKGKAVRHARPREEKSSHRPKQTLVQVLDACLGEIHMTLQELLQAEKAQLALKRKHMEYLMSDDDLSSEVESNQPLSLRKRMCCLTHDDNGTLMLLLP